MRKLARILTLLGFCLASLLVVQPALAFPPLPSSFYGTVKVNNANVPDGTPVKALINGKVFAQTKTLTYNGDSVYSLDVLGDDTDTAVVDGGVDGDKIVFTIGDQAADQTGIWKGGTNVNLNLSVGGNAAVQITSAPPTPVLQSTSIVPASTGSEKNTHSSTNGFLIIAIVLVAALLFIGLWVFFARKPKA